MADLEQMDVETKYATESRAKPTTDAVMDEMAPSRKRGPLSAAKIHQIRRTSAQRRKHRAEMKNLNKVLAGTSITKQASAGQMSNKKNGTAGSTLNANVSSRTRSARTQAAEVKAKEAEDTADTAKLVLSQLKASAERLQQNLTAFDEYFANFQADTTIQSYSAIKEEVKCMNELLGKQNGIQEGTTDWNWTSTTNIQAGDERTLDRRLLRHGLDHYESWKASRD